MRVLVPLLLLVLSTHAFGEGPTKIHLFIALCDNLTQGIQPVGAKIGNGDDPDNNLYWGCSDGAGRVFPRSKLWKQIEVQKDVSDTLLRRAIHRHKATGAILVIDAYRGSAIKQCVTDFLRSSEGIFIPKIGLGNGEQPKAFGAESDLIAYIGHNGLMEFHVPRLAKKIGEQPKTERDAIVLACVSDRYFSERLAKRASRPVLMTSQLMYPGAFLLHDALEGWLRDENPAKIRDRAARAYVKNQKISFKAARGIFATLD